jgi:hypothetical protein
MTEGNCTQVPHSRSIIQYAVRARLITWSEPLVRQEALPVEAVVICMQVHSQSINLMHQVRC